MERRIHGCEVEMHVCCSCFFREITSEACGQEGAVGRDDFRMRGALVCSEAKEIELEERKMAEIPGRERSYSCSNAPPGVGRCT